MSASNTASSSNVVGGRSAARDKVFQIAATTVEPQLPDVAAEIRKWRLGDAALDAQQRALVRHQSRASLAAALAAANYDGSADASAATLRVDTIRLSAAPDQVQLNRFVALHTPASLHQKQLTNFEVRRLAQRTKAKPPRFIRATMGGGGPSSTSPLRGAAEDAAGTGDRDDAHFCADPHAGDEQRSSSSNAPSDSKNGGRESRKPEALAGLNEQMLSRKAAELQQMIRERARERAKEMPLPPRDGAIPATTTSARDSKPSPSRARPTSLQQWYHRLGLEPPKRT